ncbi:hypothetical protein BGZ83_007396 [Gryganskiella cystojenkinii]|nr:hypothetical protein BGZ83_007396 [Gryganskiella cystojenkinii]
MTRAASTSAKASPSSRFLATLCRFRPIVAEVVPSSSKASLAASTTGSRSHVQVCSQVRPTTLHQVRHYTSKQHFYQNRILDPYVSQTVTPITLRQLVVFGRNMQTEKLLKSANYVRTELPVRLAHRIRDFQNLPFIVGTNPHIEKVYELYWHAFDRLRQVDEIKTLEDNDRFCELVKGLLNDHLVVIPQLALGIMESSKHIERQQVDQFMNKMLRSRISRRVLAEQHISLTANFNSPSNHLLTDKGYIGIIYTHCNPREIVERTALLAAETCRRQQLDFIHKFNHGDGIKDEDKPKAIEPPKVILDGSIDAEFSYIPDHIEYILYELLKNSMRFVMLNARPDPLTGELPPIQITVCEGNNDITFRISDRGGGIPPEMESHLWSYSQSPITARFANFEKISKMAATVQEQMVSPSRRSLENHPLDDTGLAAEIDAGFMNHHAADLTVADEQRKASSSLSSSTSSTARTDVELPPPPPNHKAQYVSEAQLLLDRHAQDRMRNRDSDPNTRDSAGSSPSSSSPSSSSSTSPVQPSSTLSSSSPPRTIIDTSSQPSMKHGHLDRQTRESAERQHDQSMHLGIGLPMSRVYAEYWGGDLKVYTMHGYGTDAYARFCKFGNIYENFDV